MRTGSSVLDASALLAFLKDEPGSDEIENLLREAETGGAEVCVNQINLGEVYFVLARELSREAADVFFHEFLPLLPIRPVLNSMDDVVVAARLKDRLGLHYTDAFAAITAVQRNATLLTADRDFEKAADEIEIRWLR